MASNNIDKLDSLIVRCIQGSRRAQNTLYKEVFPYAMSVTLRYSKDRTEALELVNFALFKVFRGLESYHPDLSFKTWLRKILINTCIDHYKKKSTDSHQLETLDNLHEVPSISSDILDQISANALLSLIQDLPPAYRMVFTLYAIEGFSHKEIAQQLKISEGTSKSNYYKARMKLMVELSNQEKMGL